MVRPPGSIPTQVQNHLFHPSQTRALETVLGDMSLGQYMGERYVLQPYGEDRPPIGVIA
jgi:hypothetical protein